MREHLGELTFSLSFSHRFSFYVPFHKCDKSLAPPLCGSSCGTSTSASWRIQPAIDECHSVINFFNFYSSGFRNLTNWTSSPFLPSVGSLVTVARSLVAESHLAELALVRLDPQVDPDMPL